MNGFLRFKGFKFILSIFMKIKNLSFICGEHRVWKFRRKNSSLYVQAVFGHFLRFFKEILKGARKSLKNAIKQPIWIFCRNFYARCSPQIKDMFFLFTKIEKINLKPLKRKNPFTFLNFPHFLKDSRNVLRSVNDCSVKSFKLKVFT